MQNRLAQEGGFTAGTLNQTLKEFFPRLREGMVSRALFVIGKVPALILRKQIQELEKMRDLPMKYVLERNLSLIYHDPETGMPRLVNQPALTPFRKTTISLISRELSPDSGSSSLKS